ncbi:hypothetical protein HNR44_000703 [Geomicrobium halophilum]|uniref:Amidohydrolase 3 domain-containing protein n=1 Tax=Geomicrobium halophilum TaxID=549000 RepID=A0A841PM17_9BACL|nr:amidohydrolase [Geomicrobium halophilum]MBB6448754.1 hypothetical protein [Geomicrobium halophilum]
MNKKNNRIFFNGCIFTANPEQPYANTMVVQEGKIDWIGDQGDLEGISGEWMDLHGRRILPGFIDAHLHPLYLADAEKQISCTPPLVNSIEDLLDQIRKQTEGQENNTWIQGWGYDEGKLREGRAPTRWDLDRSAVDVPVIITRTCGHIVTVNSVALEMVGITKETPNPEGGQIDKDANGEPTGILRENARDLVHDVMPVPTLEESADSLAALSPKLLGHGITAITELMARTEPVDYLDIYGEARDKGLKPRTVLYYKWEDLANSSILNEENTNNETPLHIGGIKLFSDGSVSGQTAWVNPPYSGGENTGIPMTSKETLMTAAKAAKKHRVQLVVHAMGEKAIDLIIDTFAGQKGWLDDAPSIRIEHAAMPTKRAIERAAEMGIAFVPQPIFLFAEIESYHHNLGPERTKQAYPIQSMLETGIKLAFSSDAPATPWADPVNPFVGIKAAVTRKAYDGTDTGQDQRVDVATAIRLYTSAAQQITRVPRVGQLTEGYYADFMVLDQDILNIDVEDIDQVQVEETYMSGEKVYQKQ